MDHLAIPVRDQARSRRFYETYFGFDARPPRRYGGDVLMLYNAAGFALALGPTEQPITPPAWMHFGIGLPDHDAVLALHDRLVADGVEVVEKCDEQEYVSLKCRDPDGYIVEAAWEPESDAPPVRELRVAVTAPDYDEAVAFYRDALGLREREAFASADGRVTILEAGRATLELLDPTHAAFVDEVEVGRGVAGHVRIAFEVDDSATTTRELAAAGATVVAEPTRTPWNSLNARLEGPAGLQLTLFTELAA